MRLWVEGAVHRGMGRRAGAVPGDGSARTARCDRPEADQPPSGPGSMVL